MNNIISFFISLMFANGFVYGKLRVCVRGFSEGKSDVANVQRPLNLAQNSNFLYTLLATVFYFHSQFKFSEIGIFSSFQFFLINSKLLTPFLETIKDDPFDSLMKKLF